MSEKEEVLLKIANLLNESEVFWGVGASLLLVFHGIVHHYNDIDLIVAERDIEKADEILSSLGRKKVREPTETYATGYFYEYVIDGVEIDVMCNFKICREDITYLYDFDCDYELEFVRVKDIDIALTRIEDWYLLYMLMPNREKRIAQIERYFEEEGIVSKECFKEIIKPGLPKDIKARVEKRILSLS